MISQKRSAIVFMAWGQEHVEAVFNCIAASPFIAKHDVILVTDQMTDISDGDANRCAVIRADFELNGLLRKSELWEYLPKDYDVFLFLDSDIRVLDDISFGFNQALRHGVALSPAPHYSLDHFYKYGDIMAAENVGQFGQVQYNTGVIFFSNCPEVESLMREWKALSLRYADRFKNDQPHFSLAMEKLGLNPYTLSISYNYRAFGDAISGVVRIWHSYGAVPEGINDFGETWPPRRAWPDLIYRDCPRRRLTKKSRFGRLRYWLRKVIKLRQMKIFSRCSPDVVRKS